jgi:hypothetical protein
MADNELLADYEDEPEYPTAPGAGAVTAAGGDEADKKNYAGIHSSGFRCVSSPPSLFSAPRAQRLFFIIVMLQIH